MTDAVLKPNRAVASMSEDWDLVSALLGGTKAMRKAGEKHLPMWPAEEKEAYKIRLSTATLFPAYKRTVDVLAAKPFSKPLTIGENVPSSIKEWCDDIDLQGRNLHAFAAGVTHEALGYGISGILVDYPRAGELKTQAAEKAAGVRPYFVHIHPQQLLGWKAEQRNGEWQLTQLRIMEERSKAVDEFTEESEQQIRVLYPGRWEIWRKDNKGQWNREEQGATSLMKIPFVPVYGGRTGFMQAEPPLIDLAYQNIKHWQSQSDQDTILHVARVPILVITGVADDTTIAIGAASAIKLTDPQSKVEYAEHSGQAIEAGRKSLLDLEDRMRQTGAELLVIKPGNITESQTLADNEPGMCTLQRIAEDAEDAIDMALQLMAEWVKEPSGGNVTLFKDFGSATLAEASAELLLKANMAGKLSNETLLGEFKRRGILAPDISVEEEQEKIDSQPPQLGTLGENDKAPPDPVQQRIESLLTDGDD